MAQEQAPPAGPDLTQGVALGDLVGGKLVGHVGSDEVLRYRKGKMPSAGLAKHETPAAKISLPAWLARNAAMDKQAVRSITPSSAIEESAVRPLAGIKAALLRGSLTHRLMQSLPDIPAERRAKTAQEYLARRGGELTAEVCKAISDEVMQVLDDQHFRELFGPNSRAEVPIIGRVVIGDELMRVSGQVDRLADTDDAVLIADFKTGRNQPARFAAYVRQLALYRAVLRRLYPDKTVRAAIVWTEAPDLMELSTEVLDEALSASPPRETP